MRLTGVAACDSGNRNFASLKFVSPETRVEVQKGQMARIRFAKVCAAAQTWLGIQKWAEFKDNSATFEDNGIRIIAEAWTENIFAAGIVGTRYSISISPAASDGAKNAK